MLQIVLRERQFKTEKLEIWIIEVVNNVPFRVLLCFAKKQILTQICITLRPKTFHNCPTFTCFNVTNITDENTIMQIWNFLK
jgi:hypothetical protein